MTRRDSDAGPASPLVGQFGQIDIYLFDQLLRGVSSPGMRVLDAGCGSGRNLVYLLREGYEVFGADGDAEAVPASATWRPAGAALPRESLSRRTVEAMSFADGIDGRGHQQRGAPLRARRRALRRDARGGIWRVLKPGGLFFCRLASRIGMEDRVEPVGDGRFALPDGSERYLVDEARLLELTRRSAARCSIRSRRPSSRTSAA